MFQIKFLKNVFQAKNLQSIWQEEENYENKAFYYEKQVGEGSSQFYIL